MSDAFEIVTYNGKRMDKKTRAFVQAMEEKLGYTVSITQGSYNAGGVAASAGTHDAGGVLDLPAYDWERKLRVIKDLGGWGWYRPAIPGLWGAHIHFGIRKHGNLSRGAAAQEVAYDNRRDGLKSNGYDGSYRPAKPVVFQYPVRKGPKVPKPNNVTKARDFIVDAIQATDEAIARIDAVHKSRRAVKRERKILVRQRRRFRKMLARMPKR